jgi:hypothetical protein
MTSARHNDERIILWDTLVAQTSIQVVFAVGFEGAVYMEDSCPYRGQRPRQLCLDMTAVHC